MFRKQLNVQVWIEICIFVLSAQKDNGNYDIHNIVQRGQKKRQSRSSTLSQGQGWKVLQEITMVVARDRGEGKVGLLIIGYKISVMQDK